MSEHFSGFHTFVSLSRMQATIACLADHTKDVRKYKYELKSLVHRRELISALPDATHAVRDTSFQVPERPPE